MVKCTFCNENLKPGTGKTFVKKDGKVLYFCSMKCEKNMLKLKRKPAYAKWTTKKKKVAKK
jgi:large subunit ribosomal protein L24e